MTFETGVNNGDGTVAITWDAADSGCDEPTTTTTTTTTVVPATVAEPAAQEPTFTG
ncbi:MAG: hypothetical protein U5R31_00595 [Acidimicrobiia bacterium]|nr:hypothetical protein [Acidimicrobiia bacterium]